MGYFSYGRSTLPSSRCQWERRFRFPQEKASSSPSEEAGQHEASLRFRCREAGLTPPPTPYLPPGARRFHLEASQVASKLHPQPLLQGDATREGHFPALSLLSSKSVQPQKRNGFPQPSASMLAVPGSDLIGPRDPPSCRVRGPAAAADGQLRSRLTPEPGKGPNPGEGHHKHLMKWIWRRWGWRGGYDRPAEQSWEEMSSSPRSLCPASPQSSRGHRS